MTRATAREAIRQYYWGGPYLLDTYTGAAFAYSFRRLRKTYYGPMVRLRDTTNNAEKDFGTNYLGVFDAAGVVTWLGGHSAAVVTWYDQSGNGLDVTQSTAGDQFSYSATGLGSKPTCLLDGTQTLARATTADTVFGTGAQATVFGVLNQDSTQANNTFFAWDLGGSNRALCHSTLGDVIYWDLGSATDAGGGGRLSVAQPGGWDNAAHIVELYRDSGGTQGIVVDGTSLATGARDDLVSSGTVRFDIGSSQDVNNLKGFLSEVVYWTTDLGSTNRSGARTNINSYYSVF
jgi:hypothetical protein